MDHRARELKISFEPCSFRKGGQTLPHPPWSPLGTFVEQKRPGPLKESAALTGACPASRDLTRPTRSPRGQMCRAPESRPSYTCPQLLLSDYWRRQTSCL